MQTKSKFKSLLIPILSLFLFQNCSDKSFVSQENSASSEPPSQNIFYDCSIGNETITENDSKTFYLSSSVPYGSTCQSENRVCTRGYFAGTYQYTTCEVNAPHSCLHNGATIAHGDSVTAYLTSSTPFGQSCTSEVRTCNDGILSGSYLYTSCAPGVPSSCIFNGMNLAHGASVAAFATSSVAYGLTCQLQTRTCNNGTLSGSYAYASCAVDAPATCLFNGVTIPHNGTVSAFAQSNVPFWMDCADVMESRTCSNGTLSGSYPHSTCSE